FGLTGAGGVAIFGDAGGAVSLVASISALDRLLGRLAVLVPAGATVVEHRGGRVTSWPVGGGWGLAWVVRDGWLIGHVGPDDPTHAWLDPILAVAAGTGLGETPELQRAVAHGQDLARERGGRPTAVGLVRPAYLGDALASLGADPSVAASVQCAASLAG